jgi:hypothetical protein
MEDDIGAFSDSLLHDVLQIQVQPGCGLIAGQEQKFPRRAIELVLGPGTESDPGLDHATLLRHCDDRSQHQPLRAASGSIHERGTWPV